MTKRNTLFHTMLAAALMLLGAQAQADLILTEGDAAYSGPGFTPFVMDADWLEGIVGSADDLFMLYKDNQGGNEEGSWQNDYSTSYSRDLKSLWIINDGGGSMPGALWLVVKDGRAHDPAWYVFDISGWDGMMDIHAEGLFPLGGSISNVQIFGPESSVPEPGTLALFGAALVGFGLARRRKLIASKM